MTTIFLNRKEQAKHCQARGLKVTPAQLAKLASIGGGPRYALWGNQAVSTPEWIDEWIEQKLTAPRRSTSDVQICEQRASKTEA
jgi:hypothetical protein